MTTFAGPGDWPLPAPGAGATRPTLQPMSAGIKVEPPPLPFQGGDHASRQGPIPVHGKVPMPHELLSRIEGVVTEMERSVAEEQRWATQRPEVKCHPCGTALSPDASFCHRCGNPRHDEPEGPDVVQTLGQRLEALDARREAAERRANHLQQLRRIVAEGRHHQPGSHYLSLSDDLAFSLRKRGDGESAAGSLTTVVTTGSDEVAGEQADQALAEVEAKFAEELGSLGEAGAEARLHDRLQLLLKAVLHRERVVEERLQVERDTAKAAESDLQELEDSSRKVVEDCRALQARVHELEHHETQSRTHGLRVTELEERLQEQSRLLESARAREVALREEIQDGEETNRVLRAASVRRGADAERLEELEHENETLKRQQSKWQQHLEQLQVQLTEEQASRTLESEKELDEARRELAAQRDLIEELRDQALRLGQDAREAEALAQKEIDYLQGRVATLEGSVQTPASQGEALEELRSQIIRLQEREQLHHMTEERNRQLQLELASVQSELSQARAGAAGGFQVSQEPIGSRRPSVLSSSSGGSEDFRRKVRNVKRRASDLLRQASAPNAQLLDLELQTAARSLSEGGSLHGGLQLDAEGKAHLTSSRRSLAALVDSVEHDLAALREEALTHHELSQEELELVSAELELSLQNCRDESALLKGNSALTGMPEPLLERLMESLGYLESRPPGGLARRWDDTSPMHWAAEHGRRDLVEYLLRQEGGGALLHVRDRQGRTPLEVAAQSNQVSVLHFLRSNMDAHPKGTVLEELPEPFPGLPQAYRQVLQQVESRGWQSVQWKQGFTMLHWAAQKNEVDLAKHLLSLGADPDARDTAHQRTALDVAERHRNMEVAAVLRPATRSRNLDQLSFPQTARASLPAAVGGAAEAAAVPAQRRRSDTGLRRKAQGSRRRSTVVPEAYLPVLEQIDELGWENMQWARGFTLLHWAALNNQPALVQQLFAKGASPLQADDDGRTALDYARESGSRAVVEALKLYQPPDQGFDDLDRE